MTDNDLADSSEAFIDLLGQAHYDESFGGPVVNATGVSNRDIHEALGREHADIARMLGRWAADTRPTLQARNALTASTAAGAVAEGPSGMGRRQGGLFYRDRYLTPVNPYDQMRTAYAAVEQDDVVSGVAENTESLAFGAMSMYLDDEEAQDAMNQWAAQVDLDSRMRECWRELFTVSQIYVAMLWGTKTYRVRGKGEKGRPKRKEIQLYAPTEMSLLDPLKIVPVGTSLFRRQQLAWCATRNESARFNDILGDDPMQRDDIVEKLIVSKYEPPEGEKRELQNLGIDTENLWLLNSTAVFCHSATKTGYQRFASLRLRSIFELLDIKQQLRQMERAHLIGATNFIIVVTKGTDQHPAEPEEVTNLQMQVQTMARLPVLVGDHRLHIEIVTPKMDLTLKAERWNAVDSRITARLYGMFMLGNYAAGASGDDSSKLVKVVAKGMESKRHMLRRSFERFIFRPMFEVNEELDDVPKLMFHPRSIALDFDPAWAAAVTALNDKGDLSRETTLGEFDFDQSLEAKLKQREKDNGLDDIFQTQIPYTAPQAPGAPVDENGQPAAQPAKKAAAKKAAAKKAVAKKAAVTKDNGGGRNNGGGAAPGTGQGQPPKNPRKRSDRGKKKPAIAASLKVTVTDADDQVVETFDNAEDYQDWLAELDDEGEG